MVRFFAACSRLISEVASRSVTDFSVPVLNVAYFVSDRPPGADPADSGLRSKVPETNIRLWPARNPEVLSTQPVTAPVAASMLNSPSPVGASSTTLPAAPVKVKRISIARLVGVISALRPLSRSTA